MSSRLEKSHLPTVINISHITPVESEEGTLHEVSSLCINKILFTKFILKKILGNSRHGNSCLCCVVFNNGNLFCRSLLFYVNIVVKSLIENVMEQNNRKFQDQRGGLVEQRKELHMYCIWKKQLQMCGKRPFVGYHWIITLDLDKQRPR